MTCIVAISDGEQLLFAADSAATGPPKTRWAAEILNYPEPKVFARDSYLFGICGSYRLAQILRYRAELPELPAGTDVESFLVRDFAPAIGAAVERFGLPGSPPGLLGESSVVLLGIAGQIWAISADMTVFPTATGSYAAIGSGRHWAYGALYALERSEITLSARRRAELALEAAALHNVTVRSPWHFVSTVSPDPEWSSPLSSVPESISIPVPLD